jgi:hypothetical protein
MEFTLLPSTSGEDIMRRDPSLLIRHVIMQEDSVLDSHGPQACVGNVQPMNRRVKHHSASDGHDDLHVSLGHGIMMVRSGSSKSHHLFKLGELRCKFF